MALPFDSAGSGPAVVLVNGASPMAWGNLPARLATQHRVVTYARRGFPPNERLGLATSLREHTEDLGELLEKVGRSAIVGWSSGGVIALDLAIRRPDLVSGLVVLEGPLHAKRRPRLGVLRAVLGARLKARKDPERGARHFLAWALSRTDGRPSDIARLDQDGLRQAAPAIVHELPHATGEKEIARADLRRLDVDTTWLVGSASVPGNRELAARTAPLSDRISVSEVDGAGHAIALDAPQAVASAVDDYSA